jgi:sugar phosphate isomerase/epimerase
MKTSPHLTRRSFLQFATLAAAALPVGFMAQGQPGSKANIKVGCLSWCFHNLGPAPDPEPAIELIGEMGFDGIELILTASDDIKGFWTDAKMDRLKTKLDHAKLVVSQFAIFQPVVEGLSSTKSDERERGLDHFEAGCRIAKKLGSPLINVVAPWARELKGPGSYLPRYYDVEKPAPGEKYHIDIADGFDWEKVWNGYIATTKDCLARAKAHGLKFSIENHTHTLLPDTGSFLRLWDSIRDRDLGINLDAGWAMLNREYPPVAVYKVRGHLMNLHMRDIDGLMRRFSAIGDGVMDFKAIVDALKKTGFNGFASLEQDTNPGDREMKETCQRYLKMMREYIG